jgi:hypothetical protein
VMRPAHEALARGTRLKGSLSAGPCVLSAEVTLAPGCPSGVDRYQLESRCEVIASRRGPVHLV